MANKETKKEKKKNDKITYVDDGRSFADMSGVQGGFNFSKKGTSSSFKDIWETYWMAVRMMFKPMLVVIGFLCAVFGLATLALLLM